MSVQRLFHYAAYADKYGGKVQETTLYGLTAQVYSLSCCPGLEFNNRLNIQLR